MNPSIHNKNEPKPALLYPAFWHFAAERQNIFFKEIKGNAFLSEDPIFIKYKFKNSYRASDPSKQFLIKHIIYSGDQSSREVFFRTMLFIVFDSIEVWQRLKTILGHISYRSYSFGRYNTALKKLLGNRKFEELRIIDKMIDDGVPSGFKKCKNVSEVCNIINRYLKVGRQLSFYYAVDINYSILTNFSEMEFVRASPRAKAGIEKCFLTKGDYSYEEIIELMAENQEMEFEKFGIKFKSLWGRRLQLIDIENLFCEVDKYLRAGFESEDDISDLEEVRTVQSAQLPKEMWYPPKWDLNRKMNL